MAISNTVVSSQPVGLKDATVELGARARAGVSAVAASAGLRLEVSRSVTALICRLLAFMHCKMKSDSRVLKQLHQ